MLDAAAVKVNRTPVRDFLGIERQLRRSSDRRSEKSTTTNRRTYPSCPSRASPARRTAGISALTNSGMCPSGESPRPVNSAVFGSMTGSLSKASGNHSALLAIQHRDRRSPVPLPRDAPVLQTELDRRLRRCPAGCASSVSLPRRALSQGRRIRPELTRIPSSDVASVMRLRAGLPLHRPAG